MGQSGGSTKGGCRMIEFVQALGWLFIVLGCALLALWLGLVMLGVGLMAAGYLLEISGRDGNGDRKPAATTDR